MVDAVLWAKGGVAESELEERVRKVSTEGYAVFRDAEIGVSCWDVGVGTIVDWIGDVGGSESFGAW